MLVALGGSLGAVSRFACGIAMTYFFGKNFPWGTLFVNVLGSFIMGGVAAYFSIKHGTTHPLALFIMVGFLGSFTTFSSFSLDTLNLFLNNQVVYSIINIIFNLSFCLVAVIVGMYGVKILL